MLTPQQIDEFRTTGHLTVANVFSESEMREAVDDLSHWSDEFLQELPKQKKGWYLEPAAGNSPALRKLDNPVFHRPKFLQLARHRVLTEIVEQLIGEGVSIFFSQVFMKPPEIGGPKPVHQDNYYFGPDDLDATLTAWIALDEATKTNGCLFYSQDAQQEVIDHIAPLDEPFNLQIPESVAEAFEMQPAPVPRGGVSFHHGNTLHGSAANLSKNYRRAAALHYLRNDASLISPALAYDPSVRVDIGKLD